jgi:hypothetical protein
MVASTASVARKSAAASTWPWVASLTSAGSAAAARAAAAAVSVHRPTTARSESNADAIRRMNLACLR